MKGMDHHASKLKGLAWAAAGCAVGMCFAFGISPLARAIPWSWEKGLASVLESDAPGQACRADPEAQALLHRLVARLFPIEPGDKAFSIDAHIVQSPVVNAYATLGGHIFIDSGLLKEAESPEELAGVLAHEIGHVQHRDIMKGALIQLLTAEGINMIFDGHSSAAIWANYFLNMDFSRSQEAQADEAGLQRLQIAHVDNRGFKDFFERMEKSGSAPVFLSNHPSYASRLAMAETFANREVHPIMTQGEWNAFKNYCSTTHQFSESMTR
jgi:beta-barrel assembly-enhancing protease